MAYTATLLNRLAQRGSVAYDLLVTDDAGSLPSYRHSIGLPSAQDTANRRNAIVTAAVTNATQDQTTGARRARMQALRDAAADAIAAAIAARDAFQAALDGGNF